MEHLFMQHFLVNECTVECPQLVYSIIHYNSCIQLCTKIHTHTCLNQYIQIDKHAQMSVTAWNCLISDLLVM